MDRNTIIGLALIGLILVGYSIMTKPARERQMAERRRLDSIARVEQIRAMEEAQRQQEERSEVQADTQVNDSVARQQLNNELGDFAAGALGTEEQVILENEKLKLTFSTLG